MPNSGSASLDAWDGHLLIVSGGQTGADRAALDWAIGGGIPHAGWCPSGRIAEDGVIPQRYRLRETPTARYALRTEWNVRDSDATLIVSIGVRLTGGSLLTQQIADASGKPWLHVARGRDTAERTREFLRRHRVRALNVAGPRASKAPEVYRYTLELLDAVVPGALATRQKARRGKLCRP
jgi:hypothetical protein